MRASCDVQYILSSSNVDLIVYFHEKTLDIFLSVCFEKKYFNYFVFERVWERVNLIKIREREKKIENIDIR